MCQILSLPFLQFAKFPFVQCSTRQCSTFRLRVQQCTETSRMGLNTQFCWHLVSKKRREPTCSLIEVKERVEAEEDVHLCTTGG